MAGFKFEIDLSVSGETYYNAEGIDITSEAGVVFLAHIEEDIASAKFRVSGKYYVSQSALNANARNMDIYTINAGRKLRQASTFERTISNQASYLALDTQGRVDGIKQVIEGVFGANSVTIV